MHEGVLEWNLEKEGRGRGGRNEVRGKEMGEMRK